MDRIGRAPRGARRHRAAVPGYDHFGASAGASHGARPGHDPELTSVQLGNILIIEDNPDLAYGLRTGLEIEGYSVTGTGFMPLAQCDHTNGNDLMFRINGDVLPASHRKKCKRKRHRSVTAKKKRCKKRKR